jgi:hypothetical protein
MKSKKVLTILLSLAIMVTFMPTMAFAAEEIPTGGHSWEGTDSVDADYEGLKVLVAPTCTDYGIGEITCTTPLNGEDCGAVKTVWINPTGHKEGERVRLKAGEIIDKMAETNPSLYDEAYKESWFITHNNGYCEGYVTLCDNCGQPIYKHSSTSTTWRLLANSSNWLRYIEFTAHTAPKDTLACAASFTCDACGVEGRVNDTYNETTSENYHAVEANLTHSDKKYHMKDTTGDDNPDEYIEVISDTCKTCKEVINQTCIVKPDGTPIPSFAHTAGDWVVESEPTCTTTGLKVKYCTVCGQLTGDQQEIDALGHDYETIVVAGEFLGLDEDLMYSVSRCKRIGCENPIDMSTATPIGFVPDPAQVNYTYTYTKVADANCEQGAWIREDVFNGELLVYTDYYDDEEVEEAITDGYVILIDGKYYERSTKAEVPYEKAQKHDFGPLTTFVEATCTDRAIEGSVCSKCGKVNHATTSAVGKALGHDTTTVTVAATCGTKGYSYDTCSRCKQVVLPDGAKNTGTAVVDGEEVDVYNVVDPIVSEGTPCSFEWKVTKAATETEDGEKALVCSVCGTVKDGSQTVIPADVATAEKKAAVEAATPAVEAAADVIDNAATYTAKSVEAVKEAKDMLNAAIASGSAADVKAMTEKLQKATSEAVEKAENGVKAKNKTLKVKAKNGKVAKTKTFKKAAKASNATGKVTFKKANKKGGSKIVVKSNGNVIVKKGLKKGTYKVAVTANAAGDGNTLAGTANATVKVVVK